MRTLILSKLSQLLIMKLMIDYNLLFEELATNRGNICHYETQENVLKKPCRSIEVANLKLPSKAELCKRSISISLKLKNESSKK